jgi:hypothetical protein
MGTDEGKTLFYDREKGLHVRDRGDGSIEARAYGNTVSLDSDGNVTLNMENIQSVGIKNITELKSYKITNRKNAITHVFSFLDGAIGEISYSPEGKIYKFGIKGGCSVQATHDGEITLSKKPSKGDEPE